MPKRRQPVAAHRILSLTYPAYQSIFDTALAASLAARPDGVAKDTGIALGLSVANAVWAARQNDALSGFIDYTGQHALQANGGRPARCSTWPRGAAMEERHAVRADLADASSVRGPPPSPRLCGVCQRGQ